jgi:hypothetical protein
MVTKLLNFLISSEIHQIGLLVVTELSKFWCFFERAHPLSRQLTILRGRNHAATNL